MDTSGNPRRLPKNPVETARRSLWTLLDDCPDIHHRSSEDPPGIHQRPTKDSQETNRKPIEDCWWLSRDQPEVQRWSTGDLGKACRVSSESSRDYLAGASGCLRLISEGFRTVLSLSLGFFGESLGRLQWVFEEFLVNPQKSWEGLGKVS